MRLSLPGPSDLRSALEHGAGTVEQLLSIAPRAMTLLAESERLLTRIDQLVDRIEQSRADADAVIARTDVVATDAEALLARTTGMVERLTPMLDGIEPPVVRLQPTLDRLAETTSPHEVDALVDLINLLPHLAQHLEADIIPVLDSLSTVAPDVHDLLDVTRQMNEVLGAVPGLGRIKKRVEEDQRAEGG